MLQQGRNRIGQSSTSLGATARVLAIVFVLTLVTGQPAQAQTYNVLHPFTGGQDGAYPVAGLTIDTGGQNLYGTAQLGGVGYGSVYQLKQKGTGWVFNTLYNFKGGSDGTHLPASYHTGGHPAQRLPWHRDGSHRCRL